MSIALTILCMTRAQSESPALEAASSRFWRQVTIEGAGIFWIAAELAILFAVTVGLRVLRARPLPDRIALTRSERRRAWVFGLSVIALLAGVFGRYVFWAPLPIAMQAAGALNPPDIFMAVQGIVTGRVATHLAIWCSFIGIWVALEIAIVAYGLRAYYALAQLTGARPAGPQPAMLAWVIAAAGTWFFAFDASAEFSRAIERAIETGYLSAIEIARTTHRFVEFVVRVAGAVWVVVEWVAAVYLVRGFVILRRFFRERARVG